MPDADLPAPEWPDDKEFMTTLAKGLAVLTLFGRHRPSMTLSQAAAEAGMPRATARRVLRTLVALGYMEQREREFVLTPAVLQLGYSYLSSQAWIERAQPPMKALSERFQETCSIAILDGTDVVYVARVQARRLMSNTLSIGSRLPAFHTSMGRVLLGFLEDAEIWRRLRSAAVEQYTVSTILDRQALFERVREDRAQGFSIVDEELERGLRSIAVPLCNRAGEAVAALNLSTHSTRATRSEMRETFLPVLRETADEIAAAMV